MLELDAYFRRIADTGPREPTIEALTAPCATPTATVPFENLEALLGRVPLLYLQRCRQSWSTSGAAATATSRTHFFGSGCSGSACRSPRLRPG